MSYRKPPFQYTFSIVESCQKIAYALGLLEGAKLISTPVKLRRESQIKTIQSSLAIEGNQLTIEQVTGLLDGKKVIGPKKDILEVTNAIKVYSGLNVWEPLSVVSLKKAHRLLMNGLIKNNGEWRTSGVGIFKGSEVAHVAPPAKRVPELIENLFSFIRKSRDISWLIKACIFHYELEFVHPFSDGNGRIGRLWQQILLMKEHPAFEYISVESMIRNNQIEYYDVLAKCDKIGDSTAFVEFSLRQILSALEVSFDMSGTHKKMKGNERLQYAKEKFKNTLFQRKDYIKALRDISTAAASRDLDSGVKQGILLKFGDKKLTKYQFI